MKVFIADVCIEYIDITSIGDKERHAKPTAALVRYELVKGDNRLSGRLTILFDEYKEMKHDDLINKIHEKLF